jgi:cold-inducible RNA-binding protein
MDTKLYVGNLSYDTTEDELRNLFGGAGTVTSAQLIKDRDSGRSKGFAFIEMSTQAEAENAIRMFNGYSLGSRELKVNKARPPEERSSAGNRGGFNKGGFSGDRNRRGGGGGNRRF